MARVHLPLRPPPTPVARPALWSGSPPESAELLVQPTLAAAELGAQPPPRPAQPHTPIPQSAWARLTSGRPRPCGGLGSEPSSEAVDEILALTGGQLGPTRGGPPASGHRPVRGSGLQSELGQLLVQLVVADAELDAQPPQRPPLSEMPVLHVLLQACEAKFCQACLAALLHRLRLRGGAR